MTVQYYLGRTSSNACTGVHFQDLHVIIIRLLFLRFLATNIVFNVFLSLFFFFLICQIKRVKDADEVPMVCKCLY